MCDSESIVKTDDTAVLNEPREFDRDELRAFVDSFVRRRGAFLQMRRRHGSPLYVLDETVLLERARQYAQGVAARKSMSSSPPPPRPRSDAKTVEIQRDPAPPEPTEGQTAADLEAPRPAEDRKCSNSILNLSIWSQCVSLSRDGQGCA